MQRSGTFVLYRMDSTTKKIEYMKMAVDMQSRDDLVTADLAKTPVFETKAQAFKYAVQSPGSFSVGELVSDTNGVRVET